MNNKLLFIAVCVLIVLLLVFGFFVWKSFGRGPSFHAVYLTTGDLYFGKLVRFPYFGLKQVYLLQPTQDPQTPVSIQRFANVFWGPEDSIRINRDQVVWMTELEDTSQLLDIIRTNPTLIPPVSSPQQFSPGISQEEPPANAPR